MRGRRTQAEGILRASGMFTSMLLIRYQDKPRTLFSYYWSLALAFWLLGLVSHRFWIISKIQATPTWAFFCLAVFVLLFSIFHVIADVRGWTKWARPIAPAGTATLTCYTIPYIWYAVQQLLGLHWPAALTNGLPGLLKALAFASVLMIHTSTLSPCRVHLYIDAPAPSTSSSGCATTIKYFIIIV